MKKIFFSFLHQKSCPGFRITLLILGLLFTLQLPQVTAKDNLIRQDDTKKVVTGTVIDANTNESLPGVSIQIKGTVTGTVTDIQGKFSISVSPSDILIISSVGYLDEEIVVGDQTEIVMKLVPDIIGLEEVVVVGYGVQKKKLVTGATVQVKSEDLVKNNVNRIESALQGFTPGMSLIKKSGQPGSDFNITIRGLGSVNGNDPLVLIDGVPGSLTTLNPSDVETVDVLKDAASAAIYGSRAGSGVILVTTKKGKAGKTQISYDFYYGLSNPTKKVDVLNAQEYAHLMNEGYYNLYPTGTRVPFSQAKLDSIDNLGHTGTDWQEEITNKHAPSQSHYLGITGGTDKSSYSISLSYNTEEGIFDYKNKSYFERYGVRVNSEHKLKKYLTVGENLTYTHRYRRGLGVGSYNNNFMRDVLQASPLIDPYDPDVYDGFGRSTFVEEQINPIASMHYNYNEKRRNDDLIGDIYIEIEPVKGLIFRSDFGMTLALQNNSTANDSFKLTSVTYRSVPEYKQYMSREFGYNFDNVLSYTKSIANNNILAMIGANVQDNRYFNVDGTTQGWLSTDVPVLTNVATIDTTYLKGDFGKGDSRYSFFGRISYNYSEKYLVTLSLRRDASSRFGPENRVGWFPAFSLGWVATGENFMRSVTWLNYLKLRWSWGQNGKEPYRPYTYLATLATTNRYYSFGTREVGVSPNIMPNPSLRWEASTQTDIGIDARFLNSIGFTFDFYRKNSKDWIIPNTVPSISGIAAISSDKPLINAGNVINTGVEFELNYNKSFGKFNIDLAANLAYNKNKVTEVPGELIRGSASVLYNGSQEFYRVEEGYPMGYFWGYETNGIFQTQEEVDNYRSSEETGSLVLQRGAKPGDIKRIDENNDGVISDLDKVMLGDPNPDFIYGFSLAFNIIGIDFSMNFQGVAGNQVVMSYRTFERPFNNYTADILDRWHWIDKNNDGVVQAGEGTSNTIPRVAYGNESNQNWGRFSDLYVKDAGYLRIKTINLGYDFNTLIPKSPLQMLRLYFSVTNPFTFTKYPGLDPEVGYGSYYNSAGLLSDAYASGVDVGFYPSARTYLFGLNVKF
ncbi:MAG: TonB-dependent receptor [Bacteroidales bacterium]|nr:TonB-dependent receptor [Bacteroidales bacterium]